MNYYVRNGISILNDTTKNLKDLNELGIYLAKETNIDALKSLKLLILVTDLNILEKKLNINSVKTGEEIIGYEKRKKNETIVGNLSMNPQNIALELMDYIIHNNDVNLMIKPLTTGYTIFDSFVFSFADIESDECRFYKRYDMTNEKLDIVSYMIDNELLEAEEIDQLLTSFDRCLHEPNCYTKDQLARMEKIVSEENMKKQLKLSLASLIDEGKITINDSKEDVEKELITRKSELTLPYGQKDPWEELENYKMTNDQCAYMRNTIPILIKKKIIK